MKSGRDTAVLYPGDVHILPPSMEHSLYSPEGYTQLGIDLFAESGERGLTLLLEQHFPQPASFSVDTLPELTAQILEQYYKGTLLSKARMMSLLDNLILCCIEASEQRTEDPFEKLLSEYLDANLHRTLRLAEIAEYFCISVSQLEKMCHRSYHTGVIEQLQQRRFRKAQQLLKESDLSIQEIGYLTGYPDPAHFSNFFRMSAGISPRVYRNKNRLKE